MISTYRRNFSTKVFVTGSCGQVGSSLIPELYKKYGVSNVTCTDVAKEKPSFIKGDYYHLDVSDKKRYLELAEKAESNVIVHLAAVLSASGEKNPLLCVKVNIDGVNCALETAKELKSKIYIPSTIAVFGPDLPKYDVKQDVALNPTTVYGITKVYMEQLGNYYFKKFGVDFRSIRYPGVISPTEYESHGTTDYASEIFFYAFKNKEYKICLRPERILPMAYLDDTIQGTIKFIDADNSKLKHRVYNLNGLSFSCQDLTSEISKKKFKNFSFRHEPDHRDKIAQTWPYTLNDKDAKIDWGWNPKINSTEKLVDEMISSIKLNYKLNTKTTY